MTESKHKPHFFLEGIGRAERYTYPRKVKTTAARIPKQDRAQHGATLLSQFDVVKAEQEQQQAETSSYELQSKKGVQITFDSFSGVELAVDSLSDVRAGIELLCVKHESDKVIASVFVPEGKLDKLVGKIEAYMQYKTDKNGQPLDNRKLVDAIESLKVSAIESLWTDSQELFPTDAESIFWWEVWLPVFDDRHAVLSDFKQIAERVGLKVSQKIIEFPERTVVNVEGSKRQFTQSALLLNLVSELKRAKETASFFDGLAPEEQAHWANELSERLELTESLEHPYVCLLDSGLNYDHPLLKRVVKESDCFVVNPSWTLNDECGHGTNMAGLSVYGDMVDVLSSTDIFSISHKLESVKLIRRSGDNEGEPLGAITSDGVALPEIENHSRKRVYSMALASKDGRDRGKPSSWSSSIDSLACDYLGDNQNPRLFTICSGNTGDDLTALLDYPAYNDIQDIHDPGQAWNALTVGAFTSKNKIDEDCDYEPLAPLGGLSPYSTTSVMWENSSPIKPEVVFEGGNVGYDQYSCAGLPSLKLLSINSDFTSRYFDTSEGTSAASALCSRFAASLMAQYPNYWPETIRALVVHSAYWSEGMYEQVKQGKTIKQKVKRLVRLVGYGVPNLDRAMWSADNSLSLVVQDSLRPYHKPQGKQPTTRDMHVHELPWPKESLLELGDVDVEMTVTLSYFIEPNPSSRNVSGKYSYPSHQLRFDVKRPSESTGDFQARLSREAQSAERGATSVPDPNWLVGSARNKGSIHKDIWRGSAADLAERGQIAIYPAMGWWRTRKNLQHWDKDARYSLIVSIAVPEVEVDLYSKIAALIDVPIEIET